MKIEMNQSCLLALVFVSGVSARPSWKVIPCADAPEGTFVAKSGIENEFPGEAAEPFDNFPCGLYPFDPTVPQEALKCDYYVESGNYECICEGSNKCSDIAAEAIAEFGGVDNVNGQPCAADGYELDGKIRTWWWECKKVN